ncbi:hypothetical protein ACJ8PQ_25260, partial [Serratia sp. CY74664]
MKFSLDSAFYKRWLRNSLYIFSIFSVVNYISEGVHDGSYFFIVIFVLAVAWVLIARRAALTVG